MTDNSLLQQLANRAKLYHARTGISQSQMAKEIGMADGNYSGFLSRKKGIGAEATCLLLKFTAMSKREAVAKFSKPAPTGTIMLLQEQGRRMTFDGKDDGSWVPGLSGGAGRGFRGGAEAKPRHPLNRQAAFSNDFAVGRPGT
jgi:hypothetical protein